MKITSTALPGVLIIEPKVFIDARGFFLETYHSERYASAGLREPFVQDNHSSSQKGALRGLHYQLNPFAQAKLVRVVQGRAWDVAVDIRQRSPTFGQWVGVELTGSNHRQFWIPAGFAHGFVALEDNTQFLYKTTSYYNKESERTILWNDKDLEINWPVEGLELKLTEKDREGATFKQTIESADNF